MSDTVRQSPSNPQLSAAKSSRAASEARPIRVLLADDHTLVRESLSERLNREPDITVVAKAPDADQAIVMAKAHTPDVVLMDIDMPGLICFDAAERIMALLPSARIVFLSAFFNDRYIEQALRIRARGYVTKREPPECVIAAVRQVVDGGVYFSDDVRSRMIVDDQEVHLAQAGMTRSSTLTPRELEVLRYIARGMSKKEIATTMSISVKTIENHCGSLMTKLEIHDRVALARYAIREGLAEA
jgi:DNA-binding NarL/FixJ family response regulator